MKRFFIGMAVAMLAAVSFFPMRTMAVSARNAVLMDAETGRFLHEKNPDRRGLIASTTKIMTALLICEQCNVLDRMAIPKEAVGIEGSSMYLREGEVLTLQELLYGLMLHSGNDAAVALALYCAGTVEEFAQRMNDKARTLGLTDTHFENPNGLDSPGHYSSARDLARLAAYAMKNPIFYKTVSAKTATAGGRTLRNHNKLLWQFDGADGVKTGYTRAAGRILVSSATRDGRRLIAVTMHAPDDWNDHRTLLQQGFSEYHVRQLVSAGDCLGTVQVAGGAAGSVELIAGEDFSFALAEGEQPEIRLPNPGFVYAPVSQGQDGGFAYICLNGATIGKIPLVYGQTVEMEQLPEKTGWKLRFGGGRND